MLSIEQRLQLINAGYTKDEIESMLQPEQPAPAPDPEPAPEPEPDPEPTQDQKAVDPVIEKMSQDFKQAIDDLRKQIQQQNISNVKNDIPAPMTAEDALGSLNAAPTIKR